MHHTQIEARSPNAEIGCRNPSSSHRCPRQGTDVRAPGFSSVLARQAFLHPRYFSSLGRTARSESLSTCGRASAHFESHCAKAGGFDSDCTISPHTVCQLRYRFAVLVCGDCVNISQDRRRVRTKRGTAHAITGPNEPAHWFATLRNDDVRAGGYHAKRTAGLA